VTDKVTVRLTGSHGRNATRYACERRQSKRLLCSDLVQIHWQEPDGSEFREIAILENLSVACIGLFAGVPIPEGTDVRVTAKDVQFTGRVRECVFRENGYIVGLELDGQSRNGAPDSKDFLPHHLLDVSALDWS
jgi:hypothetical protein